MYRPFRDIGVLEGNVTIASVARHTQLSHRIAAM